MRPFGYSLVSVLFFCASVGMTLGELPIRQHPANDRYFEWRGKAVALITSAEHYGGVLNADFDYKRYLETLNQDGMNYTRIFAGAYVEPVGAFGIERNTLAPAANKFIAPWARSTEPGYPGGGNKFDLDRFNPDYLQRLKDFISEADRRGIVVELTFFCSTYSDKQWAIHPFNPTNNVQRLNVPEWKKLHTIHNGSAKAYQEKLVRWLARELNAFDNLFYEIQNEPWADNHVMGDIINPYMTDKQSFPNAIEITTADSVAWQASIAKAVQDEESKLPQKHLIAQNIANFRLPLRAEDMAPGITLANFHYAYPEAALWNLGHPVILGFDETGFAGSADATYRRQAWNFLFSGGGLFNHLDYSFSVGREDGTDTEYKAPGGGSPNLRQQLSVLSRFLHQFDLTKLSPDANFVNRAPGAVARTLSSPGKSHAVYLEGRGPTDLSVNLTQGRWRVQWIEVTSGNLKHEESFRHRGGVRTLKGPEFSGEIAVRIERR